MLFFSVVEGEVGIYALPRLGGTPRRLAEAQFASWSPDGSRIAAAVQFRKEIVLMKPATAEADTIPLDPSFVWLLDLNWSPRGDRIAYLTDAQDRHLIRVVAIDGSRDEIVVTDSVQLFSPRWSPDGDALYYLRDDGLTQELRKIRVAFDTMRPQGPSSVVLAGQQSGRDEFGYAGFTLSAMVPGYCRREVTPTRICGSWGELLRVARRRCATADDWPTFKRPEASRPTGMGGPLRGNHWNSDVSSSPFQGGR